MSEATRAVLHRWIDKVNHGQFDGLYDIWAKDMVLHAGVPGHGMGVANGVDDLGRIAAPFVQAFPDAQIRIEKIFSQDEYVFCLYLLEATHKGSYFGAPATGRRVEAMFLGLYRIEDGKIAECWTIDDGLGLLSQAGALPIKAEG